MKKKKKIFKLICNISFYNEAVFIFNFNFRFNIFLCYKLNELMWAMLITQCILNWCRFFLLYRLIYICIVIGDPVIKRVRVGIPITRFKPPHFCACPKPGHGFPRSYVVVFFMFNDLMWEVNARFVDIGEVVDHYCLNFLFKSYDIFPVFIY